ncbi:hypothetical protein [Hyphobacterium sp.]|uniref:hypothetical protein n=1 Tax=Hyphobacterium sp. TaxID=2004662 RepID=UPI00374805CA
MTGISDEEFEAMLAEIDRAAERAEATLNGRFASIYRELRGLSPEDINDITPDTSDQKEYEKLMALVQEATQRNLSQAQLVDRIRQLGNTAVTIAKKTNNLANAF